MNQTTNHRAEVEAVIGSRLDPMKAAIQNDKLYDRFRIRSANGLSAYLIMDVNDPSTWTMMCRRKLVAKGTLADMLPHFDELGWLLDSKPTPLAQLTLPEVLRSWELAVPYYIGNAIADLLRSVKLPANEQADALQSAAQNIDLAVAELAGR